MLQDSIPDRALEQSLANSDASQILLDLVSTPSVSGNENGAAQKFVQHAAKMEHQRRHVDTDKSTQHTGENADSHIHRTGFEGGIRFEIPRLRNPYDKPHPGQDKRNAQDYLKPVIGDDF